MRTFSIYRKNDDLESKSIIWTACWSTFSDFWQITDQIQSQDIGCLFTLTWNKFQISEKNEDVCKSVLQIASNQTVWTEDLPWIIPSH